MAWRRLVRWGGLFLFVGGSSLAVSIGIGSFHPDLSDPLNVPLAVLDLVGIILVLVALPVLYARLGRLLGGWGLVGYLVFFSALVLLGAGAGVLQLLSPALAKASPTLFVGEPPAEMVSYSIVAGTLEVLGGVILGASIAHARVRERYAGILVILGSIVSFVGQLFDAVPHLTDLGGVLIALSLAWMGAVLLISRPEQVERAMMPAEGTLDAPARG